jgi:predicted PurR-regulated permease PerM
MLKDIFTKEMMTNAVVTLAVVMVGLAVHDKFVRPKMMGSNGGSTPSPAPAPAPAPAMDEEV